MDAAFMSRATTRLLGCAFSLAILLAAVGGCGDDGGTGPAIVTQGITGHVISAGVPLPGTVMATQGQWGIPGAVVGITDVNADGEYTLPLPPGKYRLLWSCGDLQPFGCNFWYAAGSARWAPQEADTVEVQADAEPARADFRLGCLVARVQLPAGLARTSFMVDLVDWARHDMTAPARTRLRATADAGGLLAQTFVAVPLGTYAVSILPDEAGERFWLGSAGTGLQPDSIVVGLADTTRIDAQYLVSPTTVRVGFQRVFEGVSSLYPSLAVFGPDSVLIMFAGEGTGGRFQFDLYKTRRFRLRIGDSGIERWIGGTRYADATEFVIPDGAPTMDLPPILESGLVLTFVTPEPGMPVDPVVSIVYASGKTVRWRPPFIHAQSIPVPNLEPGSYRLKIEPFRESEAGWRAQWYDRADSLAGATPVRIERELERVPVKVRLESRRLGVAS